MDFAQCWALGKPEMRRDVRVALELSTMTLRNQDSHDTQTLAEMYGLLFVFRTSSMPQCVTGFAFSRLSRRPQKKYLPPYLGPVEGTN